MTNVGAFLGVSLPTDNSIFLLLLGVVALNFSNSTPYGLLVILSDEIE